MLTTFTKSQLTAQWRLRRGLEPMRGDLTVELDGVETSAIDEAELADWWLLVTSHASAEMLEVKDLSIRCSTESLPGGGTEVRLPVASGCRRITRVKLSGWKREGQIVTPDSPEADLQQWEYTQAGAEHPVAVLHSCYRLTCYPAGEDVELLECITEGDGENFTMDSALLATMAEPEMHKCNIPHNNR